jgi:hypothetical protein
MRAARSIRIRPSEILFGSESGTIPFVCIYAAAAESNRCNLLSRALGLAPLNWHARAALNGCCAGEARVLLKSIADFIARCQRTRAQMPTKECRASNLRVKRAHSTAHLHCRVGIQFDLTLWVKYFHWNLSLNHIDVRFIFVFWFIFPCAKPSRWNWTHWRHSYDAFCNKNLMQILKAKKLI